MKLIYLVILVGGLSIIVAEKVRFDNYRVYSIEIENENQLSFLQELEITQDGLEFVESPMTTQQVIDIIVPPHKFEFFETIQIKHYIKIHNIQRLIDEEEEQSQKLSSSEFGWEKYHTLEEIYAWLDDLLKKYPKVLTNYNYGTSYENRTLRAVKVSMKKGNPTIFIESNIHAREWVTSATATYFLNELLTSSDEEIKKLANNFDWVIVPVTNVDGFAYSHSKNRLWRKTRKPHPIWKICVGTDANRNFDFHHGENGASMFPCMPTYAGPSPFSEPETKALSEFIKTFDNLKLYLSFHSYSQLLLFPYGHTTERASNYDDLYKIGLKTKQDISKRYKTNYTVGSIAKTLYLASGSSIDWAYGVQNVSLTYTFEFRDKGQYGFLLPPKQIIPNSLEVIDGLKAMVAEAKELKYL